ncbi:Zinc finger, CCHC-type, partial [Sesbania bispinosa]
MEEEGILVSSLEGLEVLLEAEGESGLRAAQRMLVGKVLSDKTLNRGATKEILSKAWGSPVDLHFSDLGPNSFLFNFSEASQARKAMDDGPWFVMGHLLSLQHWIPKASVHEVNYNLGFCFSCGIIGHDSRRCNKEKVMAIQDSSRPIYGSFLGVPPARTMAAIAADNNRRARRVSGEAKESQSGDHPADNRDKSPTKTHPDTAEQFPPPTSPPHRGQPHQTDTEIHRDPEAPLQPLGPTQTLNLSFVARFGAKQVGGLSSGARIHWFKGTEEEEQENQADQSSVSNLVYHFHRKINLKRGREMLILQITNGAESDQDTSKKMKLVQSMTVEVP